MNRRRFRSAVVGALLLAHIMTGVPGASAETTTASPTAETGVYLIWGSDSEATTMPFVRGGQVNVKWSRIQPARGTFDWADLDEQLKTYHQAGKKATVQINSEQKPSWIYDNGVARCGTYTRSGSTYDIPKYWEPNFHLLMKEMLESLAARLRSSPYSSAVLGVRAAPNLIGTEPYLLTDSGASPTAECLADWTVAKGNLSYEKSMRLTYNALMPDIRPILRSNLFLSVNRSEAIRQELLGQDKAWLFGTNADPDRTLPNVDAFYRDWVKTGITRGYYESRIPPSTHGVSWEYWRQLMELGRGVSYVATYASNLRNAISGNVESSEYRAAFDFSNKYAGFADKAALAPGGWVAFRGGSSATDDNYEMFVTQLNADGTPGADATTVAMDSSGGSNIIGPSSQRFGRFARRTDIASGRGKIYLRVAPQLKSTFVYGSRIALTYLDEGTGSINVRWGGNDFDQHTFSKGNTGAWRRVVVDAPAGAFAGGLEATSDLVISASGGDTTFHMVEIERERDSVPNVSISAAGSAKGTVPVGATATAPAGRTLASTTFMVDDVLIATDTVAPYETAWTSSAVADGQHTLKAIVTDSTGASASSAMPVTVVNNDTMPPTQVTGLAGYASTPTQIELRWSQASDDHGVSGYRVFRDDVLLGTLAQNAYVDAAAVAGTSYRYSVVSVDLAGNLGPPSETLHLSTPAPGSAIGVGNSSVARNYTSKLTILSPASAPGQVLIASISSRGSNVTMTPPPGWMLVNRTDQAGYVNQATYYRVAGASEPASHTWALSGNHSVAGVIQAFTGVDVVNPVEASAGMGGIGDASITAPGLNTAGPNRLAVGMYSVAFATDIVPPSSMTEAREVRLDDPLRPPITIEMATERVPVAGATGSRTARASSGTKAHVGQLLVLRPKV